MDDRYLRMFHSGNVGLAALLTGDVERGARAFREELALCRELVVRPIVFEALRGVAAVAVVSGDDKRAATLVGAADAHRYPTGAWQAAAREGSALTFEAAIAYALEEPSYPTGV